MMKVIILFANPWRGNARRRRSEARQEVSKEAGEKAGDGETDGVFTTASLPQVG
jgi:hypothetical protein